MSFTTKIKEELSSPQYGKKALKIIKDGFLYGLHRDVYFTGSVKVRDFILSLFPKENFSFSPRIKRGESGWEIMIKNPFSDKIKLPDGSDRNTGLFLKGIFLSCGGVSDPARQYHLELALPSSRTEEAYRMIRESGMNIKKSSRRGIPFLYAKDSEDIADFLTFIGAAGSAMEIMNEKIYKDIRNNVNRTVNFENANIEKTVKASERQLADIEYIQNEKGLDFLPEDLRQVARLRLEEPGISLREIGTLTDPKISRSGVNHRLKRISEIAQSLRNTDGKTNNK